MSRIDPNPHAQEDKDLPYVKGIHDSAGQDFILRGKTLVAVPHARPGKRIALTAAPCRDESLQKGEADATYLGIENYKLCLCCEESGGKPTLKLKERDIMELYHAPKAERSFVFYVHRHDFDDLFSIESAAYPDWLLTTNVFERKPVFLTKDTKYYNTGFMLY